ncbi:hypothetical protein EYF80_035234 [Liparis tanakae]|uniref:Uncharacterized protein n=1 Tax=Liparis tanakae TaxID=230148 RepID=A0A4Z2GMS2_9TELE|nr:hypothetical protein EYF80_035234 [Liparis tanakae]
MGFIKKHKGARVERGLHSWGQDINMLNQGRLWRQEGLGGSELFRLRQDRLLHGIIEAILRGFMELFFSLNVQKHAQAVGKGSNCRCRGKYRNIRGAANANTYSGLSPIMLRAMRKVDQMLSDIMVAAAPPGPLAALAPSPEACRWRERASRKCSTASLVMKGRESRLGI